MLFAIAYIYKFVVHQMDVKVVFLNGEEIYMEQPKGHIILVQEHTSVQISEILVGLKQAPKQWHKSLTR
jgi:hypothetical protein